MKTYTASEAQALLPPRLHVPVLRQEPTGSMVKSEMSIEDLRELFIGRAIVEAGQHAKDMGYALALEDDHGWLFIKTNA